MHLLHDDQQIGFTRDDRNKKIKGFRCSLFFFLILFINTSAQIYYFLWLNYTTDNDAGPNKFQWDELMETCIFFILYDIVFFIRVCKCIYLIRIWKNKNINPTVAEARVEFYSFFTLGLIEAAILLSGLIVIHNTNFVNHYRRKM